MKSKTSFFNRTIFRKNLTHFWPLGAVFHPAVFGDAVFHLADGDRPVVS